MIEAVLTPLMQRVQMKNINYFLDSFNNIAQNRISKGHPVIYQQAPAGGPVQQPAPTQRKLFQGPSRTSALGKELLPYLILMNMPFVVQIITLWCNSFQLPQKIQQPDIGPKKKQTKNIKQNKTNLISQCSPFGGVFVRRSSINDLQEWQQKSAKSRITVQHPLTVSQVPS